MTLREYIFRLNQVAQQAGALDLEVVYASDDEGNQFNEVVMSPCLLKLVNGQPDFIERGEEITEQFKVCIN